MNHEDEKELQNIYTGGLMRTVTPDHIEKKFLQNGYIKRGAGGLMITESGHKALMLHQKDGGK